MAPDSWAPDGKATILTDTVVRNGEYVQAFIYVKQNPSNQSNVAELIAMLRETRSIEMAVDVTVFHVNASARTKLAKWLKAHRADVYSQQGGLHGFAGAAAAVL